MRIILENELGTIELSGGGGGAFRVFALSGLGIPQYERRTFASYDFDGAVESGRRIPQRTIVIGGDYKGTERDASRLLKLLSKPCRMVIIQDALNREANVSCANVEFEQKNGVYTKFAIALSCDDPYFYDSEPTRVGLYVKEKLITGETMLPAVFSMHTAYARIEPSGDAEIEAKYVISGKRISGEEEGSIVISNLTTGKSFTLLYLPQDGEIITIDMKDRTITSDIAGNLIEYISDDSFLADLVIEKNGAELSALGYGGASDISAFLIYKNKYIEAVV